MSQRLISHNPDLKRLQDEGYEIEIFGGHLLMQRVPFVNSHKQVNYGTLVSSLTMAGDKTQMGTHVMLFAGGSPCDKHGRSLTKIINGAANQHIGNGLVASVSMSSKPTSGKYTDYYEKFTTYLAMIMQHAQAIQPGVTAKTFVRLPGNDNAGVFQYLDTASSRAGISEVTEKLEQHKIAIIGLGGTGSYVLDMIAKAPITEIHLFDDDVFHSHNAFRSPGCASVSELRKQPYKVTHYKRRYSRLHNGIVTHKVRITSRNVYQLKGYDFVFICVDDNAARLMIAEKLLGYGVPYVDVGMGLEKADSSLIGLVRTSYCNPAVNENIPESIPKAVNDDMDDLYTSNIQTNDLNVLNAALAVIKWKKHCTFYLDLEHEGSSIYTLDGNHMLNKGDGE